MAEKVLLYVDQYEELVKKATLLEVICGLYANGNSYVVGEVIKAAKGGKDDGASDHSES